MFIINKAETHVDIFIDTNKLLRHLKECVCGYIVWDIITLRPRIIQIMKGQPLLPEVGSPC